MVSHPLKSKHWCFTLNNWTEDEYAQLEVIGSEIAKGSDRFTYLVFGKERSGGGAGDSASGGEPAGTPHLQGFISFVNRRTMSSVKRDIGDRVHLERVRGTPQEASSYCKKDGDFVEYGEVPAGPGRRTDLEGPINAIRGGSRIRQVARDFPREFVKYSRGLQALVGFHRGAFTPPRKVYAFIGSAGAGKTRAVHLAEEDLFVHSGDRWFDGFEGQEAALFDDFDGSQLSKGVFLRVIDQYAMDVPVKGSFVPWTPKRVYITSNLEIDRWYPDLSYDQQEAVSRRIHCVKKFVRIAAGRYSVSVEKDTVPFSSESEVSSPPPLTESEIRAYDGNPAAPIPPQRESTSEPMLVQLR